MSFGKKKSSSSSSSASPVKPPTLTTPFGTVSGNKKGNISLSTRYLPGQKDSMNQASLAFNQVLGGIPRATNINEAFDNPFYGAISDLMRSSLGQEADEARRTLAAQQAARGNASNSSGIYAQQLLEKNIGNTLADNLLKARMGAFDAYNQNIRNMIDRGTFFQNALGTTQAQVLRPLELYQGIAPIGLQTQQYNNQLAQLQARQNNQGGGLFSSLMGSFGSIAPKLLSGG